jgi:beta-glucanase (GH16 family)
LRYILLNLESARYVKRGRGQMKVCQELFLNQKLHLNNSKRGLAFIVTSLLTVSCSEMNQDESKANGKIQLKQETQTNWLPHHNKSVVLAVNIGGSEYQGTDGILYAADGITIDGQKHTLTNIKGSQDPTLYQSYLSGQFSLLHPLRNGAYNVTLKFAEPSDEPIGSRVFNVYAQQLKVIKNLDVKLARDGKSFSSLDRTIYDVEVTDGELNITFEAITGEPVLSAIIVREVFVDNRKWQLVWNDEFNTDGAPDPAKWNYDLWPARKVNDEDQTYTDRAKNARIENGLLIIEAHQEQFNDAQYTSARLNSLNKGDFLYGKAEVRAKIPAGQGTWSAIWMLPSEPFKYATTCQEGEDWQGSSTCDAWPNSGEIDIMEHVGYDMNRIHGTVHNKAYYWKNWEQRKASIEGVNVDQEFHVYSVEWTPEDITVYFNEIPYFYYKNEKSDWRAWPFDHPYHIILNLAIGGAWGRSGGPIDNSIFPVRMEVDYVRVFSLIGQ